MLTSPGPAGRDHLLAPGQDPATAPQTREDDERANRQHADSGSDDPGSRVGRGRTGACGSRVWRPWEHGARSQQLRLGTRSVHLGQRPGVLLSARPARRVRRFGPACRHAGNDKRGMGQDRESRPGRQKPQRGIAMACCQQANRRRRLCPLLQMPPRDMASRNSSLVGYFRSSLNSDSIASRGP